MSAPKDCKTISVPQAGATYFGLSRGGSYDAAQRGEIPTIKMGRLRRVPVQALERMLENAGRKDTAG
jgi:excisionase family DNA binding protein